MTTLVFDGLSSRPDLNGKPAEIVGQDSQSGRWIAKTEDGSSVKVRQSNLRVHESLAVEVSNKFSVILDGLSRRSDLNGREGTCLYFEASKSKWCAVCNGESLLVKSQNMVRSCNQELVQDPVQIGTSHKGKTLIAARDFAPGQLVFTECPSMSWESSRAGGCMQEFATIISKFLDLPIENQSSILDLYAKPTLTGQARTVCEAVANSTYVDSERDLVRFTKGHVLADVMRRGIHVPVGREDDVWYALRATMTNAFAESGDRDGFNSLFLLLSRANHSCTPNAMRSDRNNGKGPRKDLVAIKPIRTGDEITISYLTEEMTLESQGNRQGYLKAWDILVCNCDACASPVDMTRCFSCPTAGCEGAVRANTLDTTTVDSCRLCGTIPSDVTRMFKVEVDAIAGWKKLEGQPMLMAMQPDFLPNLLRASRKHGLDCTHWVMAKLHNLSTDYHRQTYQMFGPSEEHLKAALDSAYAELRMWDHHFGENVSRQRAWVREAIADLCCGNREAHVAVSLYIQSLDEVKHAVHADNKYVDELRTKLANVLSGNASRNFDLLRLRG